MYQKYMTIAFTCSLFSYMYFFTTVNNTRTETLEIQKCLHALKQ